MKTSVGMMKKTLKVLISLVLLVVLALWGLGTLMLPGVIRDQAQAFGDQQRFETQSGADGGFTVIVEFPFQPEGGQARIGTEAT